jgi:glycosyltransferase involved in cell wall biosynthesis
VDLLLATSSAEVAELRRIGARPRAEVVVPCGVNLEQFRAAGPVAPRTPGRRRVVVVSRLVERKGIAEVVAAVADLPDVELVVAGGPPGGVLDDDPTALALVALAERLGIADRVELRGAVPRQQIPALLRSADVVACCPWYEPFGMVAVEAMACGVPVVASDIGGLAETVVHGVTGLRVPPRSPAAIAAALRQLLDHPALHRSMGEAGLHRAARYGWHAVAAQTYGHLAALAPREQPVRARRRGAPAGPGPARISSPDSAASAASANGATSSGPPGASGPAPPATSLAGGSR